MESNVSIVHYSILSLFRFLVIFWTSDRSSSVPKIVWQLTLSDKLIVWDILIGLALQYFCACPKPRHRFPLSYIIKFGMNQSSELVLWYAQSKDYFLLVKWGSDGCYNMVWLNLQQLMQSVPITTKTLSQNPTHDKVYSLQHYVIKKFVSDLWQVCGFLWFPPPIKLNATTKLKYC